jgi:hypothetical protein
MPVYRSIRIQMPDRPGALSAISTALAVQGVDIVRLDIVGHNGGMVVDDLLLSGPDQQRIGQAIGSFQSDVVVKTFEETSGDPTLEMGDGLVAVARSGSPGEALDLVGRHGRRLARADDVFVGEAQQDGSIAIRGTEPGQMATVGVDEAFTGRWVLHRQTAAAFATEPGWAPDDLATKMPGAWVAMAPLGVFHLLMFTRLLNIPFLRDELERIAVFTEVAGAMLQLRGDAPASGSLPAGKEAPLPAGALTVGDMMRAQSA